MVTVTVMVIVMVMRLMRLLHRIRDLVMGIRLLVMVMVMGHRIHQMTNTPNSVIR